MRGFRVIKFTNVALPYKANTIKLKSTDIIACFLGTFHGFCFRLKVIRLKVVRLSDI